MAEEKTIFIARTNFRGSEKVFGVKLKDRRQHMYVLGKTGVGKTALLKNMALQDIKAGRGIGIIDPHGEFVEEVLAQVPPERINDVIYFNPVDSEYPIGFNVLDVPDPKYKHLVVSDLMGIFTKIWANVWSARMEYILQNCVLALLDTPGTTLLGIPRLLVDKGYRQKIVANVSDPVVRSFWVHEFETWREQFRNEAIVPIQNKVGQFLNTSFIRNIVGQPKSTLDIPEIMNSGRILLVNVSKGRIGEDNSALLGAMIITKIQLAAMERVRIPEEDRNDFYLYVDEFQNFATDSFAGILSEARKYRLNLILAHQYVGQLVTDVSTKVRDAVFGNVGSMVVFRVGATDAELLEPEFTPEFMPADLVGLPNHHIYLKLMVNGVTSRPFSAVTLPPLQFEADLKAKEKVVNVSRGRYARPRAEVEEKIAQWSGVMADATVLEEGGKMNESTCWNCGKIATVPFKPDGKRPVYCMSCLKQIEDGKLIPLPERLPQVGKARFDGTLGELGIEFAASHGGEPRSAGRAGQMGRSPEGGLRSLVGSLPGFTGRRMGEQRGAVTPDAADSRRIEERGGPRHADRRRFERSHAPMERRESPLDKKPGAIRSQPVVRVSSMVRPLSLSELKSRESSINKKEVDARRHAINTPELRKALEEALKTQKLGGDGNQTKKIEPGETVKF